MWLSKKLIIETLCVFFWSSCSSYLYTSSLSFSREGISIWGLFRPSISNIGILLTAKLEIAFRSLHYSEATAMTGIVLYRHLIILLVKFTDGPSSVKVCNTLSSSQTIPLLVICPFFNSNFPSFTSSIII